MDFFADKKQVSNSDGIVAIDGWNKDGRRFRQLWSIEYMQVHRFFVASMSYNDIKTIILFVEDLYYCFFFFFYFFVVARCK
jgi:hypothetical protein